MLRRRKDGHRVAVASHPANRSVPGDNDAVLGAAFMALSVFLFTVEAVVARSLAGKLPLIMLIATRALSQLLVPMPWLLGFGLRRVWNTPGRPLQLMRGGLMIVSFSTFYYAAGHLPLALSTVISFSSVLWVILLAAPLLHERVGAARWSAALAGFAGILVAAQPSFGSSMPAVACGLAAGLAAALIVLIVRKLSWSEPPLVIMFYSGLCTSVVFVPLAILQWQPLEWRYALQLLLIVPCGPLAMWFQVRAYRAAEASAVAPVQYVRYLQAILLGWLLFGEVPDGRNLLGAALVIAAALGLTWLEAARIRAALFPSASR